MTDELLARAMDLLDEQPPPPFDAQQEQAVGLFAKDFRKESVAA